MVFSCNATSRYYHIRVITVFAALGAFIVWLGKAIMIIIFGGVVCNILVVFAICNANYVIKFTSSNLQLGDKLGDKLKTNFQLDGPITVITHKNNNIHKTILIRLLFYFISIITTKTSLVLTQTFLNATHVIYEVFTGT